ncbi:fra a 1-associated protein [Magnolia sinica]|uniref:fra a 1-associated protein n=1 Tax=Magnolia sinica TaxID=86752 RepID=UPI002659CB3E|nr:fra a 1-associated protein [Magnolia sinica]
MGWKWSDDGSGDSPETSSSHHPIGFGGIRDLGNPNPRLDDGADRCSTRRIVKSQCKIDEVEPGKFVRRCEKTEQLLRDCVGRPAEVVESNTQYTEDDVTEEITRGGPLPFESSSLDPFSFPGLRNDIEALERSMFGGLSRFFEAAEEMKNGFIQAFGMPMEPPPFNRQKTADGLFEEASKQRNESAYPEYSGQVRDV